MVIFCENDQSSWSIFRSKIGRAIIWRLISTFFLKTRKIRIIEFIWIAFYVIWLYGYILWKPPVIMVSFSVKNWSCHNLKVNFYIFATQSFQNVSIFKIKFKYGCALETIDVTNGDINSLNPQQWLTDNFIYCYMSTFNKVHPNLFVYNYYHMKNIFESNAKSITAITG